MNHNELKKLWHEDEKIEIIGWDFSHIKDRKKSEALPWDYKAIIDDYLSDDMTLLDLGTGGGEFLLTLDHPYEKTAVTEAYGPNYEICKSRLQPLGIMVKYGDYTCPLPFENRSMDMIIDRHESFNLKEVHRVLKAGGLFITQQVGKRNNIEISRFVLDAPHLEFETENEFDNVLQQAKTLGFDAIKSLQAQPVSKYYDVGAFVYLAKIIEWEFPDFSVEKCFDRLLELNALVEKKGYFESVEDRYIMVLRKMGNI